MQCRVIMKVYQLYLDDELEQSLSDAIQEHMDSCNQCESRIHFEVEFKSFIRRKAKSTTQSAPDDLEDKILKQIF